MFGGTSPLKRIALHEFGEDQADWAIAFDEEGFVTALIAEGIMKAGGVTLRICTKDHPPPHVHIQRRDREDISINLQTGGVYRTLPSNVRSKQLKRFSRLVDEVQELLSVLWLKNHGTVVERIPPA